MNNLFKNPLHQIILDLVKELGFKGEFNHILTFFILLFCFLSLIILVAFGIFKSIKLIVGKIDDNPDRHFSEKLLNTGVLRNFSVFIPLVFSIKASSLWFADFKIALPILSVLLKIILVIWFVRLLKSIIKTFKEHLSHKPGYRGKPLESYMQVIFIILYIFSGFTIFSILSGVSTWKLLGSLGAASAVLMLVFKDTIMGFVASIQVSVNNMVAVGDWIEMPASSANGTVADISLTTVKIQNTDRSLTMVPTYKLVTESVKNWRTMEKGGSRRIVKAFRISSDSVKPVSQEEFKEFRKKTALALFYDRFKDEEKEILSYFDKCIGIPTNLSLLRIYTQQFLRKHPDIDQKSTILVRLLDSSETGIPMEIYAFANTSAWIKYEQITAEMLEHFMVVIPDFGLKLVEIYQDDHTGRR